MSTSNNKLSQLNGSSKSDFLQKTAERIKNRKWLNYSSEIARRILAMIEDKKDLNQAAIAKALEVSPQHISKILKGQENLTLETIGKLSTAIDFELITFPEYKDSKRNEINTFEQTTETKLDIVSVSGTHYVYLTSKKSEPSSYTYEQLRPLLDTIDNIKYAEPVN